ncbi:uncharacterized protein SOCE26_032030 [Sorangium cellulosum]|uniref:Roadblock/LAMTOR2 domain-containing protein n=1 Tax=Sorangium cellulosum TaxID=56 RepID=A0A2L0ER90_SORCE|nr:hypothetical protein [Sorangium cellulosum]AUX41780.1 uncharacterized protein SOCE26_032030 [Sorangium cellulosum]
MKPQQAPTDVPRDAVGRCLEEAAQGSGVRAVALAGEQGTLLGGAGGEEDLALLAALGAGCADRIAGYAELDELVDVVSGGDDFYATRLTVCDRTFYLASIGARIPRQHKVAAELGKILAPVLSA